MKKPIFVGAAVAIVTPFNDNGINYAVLEELINFQINNKIDSILICGTTGEASTMPDEEHKKAIKFAVDTINGRVPVIAGTGSNDTRHAIELSKYAQDVGADAILSVTPYYNKTTQKGLVAHFTKIAESVSIPVILYNVPSRTSMNIDPPTLYELSKVPNINAVKECNLLQVPDVAKLCGDELVLYSGEDANILPMLSLGAKGVISVAANLIPERMHNLVMSFLDGNVVESRRLQLDNLDLINALFLETNPIPVKKALDIMGFNVGKGRLPLIDCTENVTSKLKTVLDFHKITK